MFEFFKNLKLLTKFQITIFFISTLTQSLIGFTSYYEGKGLLEGRAFQFLITITDNKKKNIEDYFENVRKQIVFLANNPNTVDAVQDFQKSFKNVASDTDPSELLTMLPSLKRFYEDEFVPKLTYNSLIERSAKKFIPFEKTSIILQYHYISNNSNPEGFKLRLNEIPSTIQYNETHKKYHSSFQNFLNGLGFYDLMLCDLQGNVIYSVDKEVDFATNLVDGTFKNSNAAKIFQQALKSTDKEGVFFMDYENYDPSYFQPCSFVATSVYAGNKKIGIVILQMSNHVIDDILTENQNWEGEGLGRSGEMNFVGQDLKVRTNTRSIQSNPLAYYNNLKNGGKEDSVTLERIKRLNTTILLRSNKSSAIVNALNGQSGNESNFDFYGNEVLDVYRPINILGTRWAMITEIDASEIFGSVYQFRNQLLLISAFIFIFQTILGFFLARGLSQPMLKIRDDITTLSKGAFPLKTEKIYKDELGEINESLNALIDKTKQVTTFADNIGKRQFDTTFVINNKEDLLGNALVDMQENLKNISEEEQIRNWLSSAKASFNEILRENNDNLEKLGKSIISNLVKYLNANQGAFFLLNDEKTGLKLVSAYAYDRYKFINKTIGVGEGLVGQCFQEKEMIYLLDVPENYAEISSGLGQANPKCILIVPLKTEESVYGVLELASLEPLKKYEIEFIEGIAESIAITIYAVKSNEQTKKLLLELQQNADKMKSQEDSTLKSLQELQEAQAIMKEREKELELSKEQLEIQNRRMTDNETILKKSYERMNAREEEMKEEIARLKERELELLQKIEELQNNYQKI